MRRGWGLLLAGCTGAGPSGPTSEPPDPSARPSLVDPSEPRAIEAVTGSCEVLTEGPVPAQAKLRIYASVIDAEQEANAIGSFQYASGSFTLATGTNSVAKVELSSHGVTVRAIAKARDIPLWVRPSHKLLHGMLSPGPRTRVELQAVEERAARVRLKHALVQPAELDSEELIPCEDLTASASTPDRLSFGKPVTLNGKEPIELRATREDGEASPRIVLRQGSLAAMEIESSAGLSRVEIRSLDGDLTGWVRSSIVSARGAALAPEPEQPLAPAPGGTVAWTCKRPVPLAVRDRDLVWIGALRDGADLIGSGPTHEQASGWWKLEVLPLPGVAVYVRGSDFEGCSRP